MPSRYQQWMYDWETRLTSVDNNRVVRPMEWGVEWARDWPCRNGFAPGQVPQNGDAEKFLREYNRRIVQSSDEFYSYTFAGGLSPGAPRSSGFQHAGSARSETGSKVRGTHAEFLRFTSPVCIALSGK